MATINFSQLEMLSRAAAAQYLGIQPQTLASWAVTGRYSIPFFRVGKSVRYRVSDLDKWLASRRAGGVGEANDA
jgi:excisionase family DNA binding protein